MLLEMLGLKPLVIPAMIHEPITTEAPYAQAMKHARNKALAICERMDPDALIIGADTIVVLDKEILGKPEHPDQAKEYLRKLSGRKHKVYTGICICHRGKVLCDYERSSVHFAVLSDEQIEDYVKTGEPMDKAGAYGIQGYGSQFIHHIRGCYFNVMGFPIHLFHRMLHELFEL